MNTHSYHLQWWSNFQDPWDNSWFCWIWHMYLEHQDCSIWSPLILYCILRSIHDIQWNIVCLFLDQLFHVTWDPIIYFINILHLSTSKHIMEHFLRRCKYLNLKLFSFDLMSLWRNYLEQMSSYHIVSWAVFTSPHFHRFLLIKIPKIGENGGSRNNHAYNACKNQGVAQD